MDKLLAALDNWKPFVAVVVGDFMLDELVFGDAERLSADAPVPILHAKETRRTPGGAASLAMDLAAMRATVRLVGVTGDDAEARTLRDRLDAEGLDSSGLVTDTTRPTTVKRNLVGLAQARHPQKMFRLDFESREPVADAARTELLAQYERLLDGADVVCIEDYAKGVCVPEVCAHVIELARAKGVPVLVDPASLDDYSRYRGATAITPNRNEAERATGLSASASGDVQHNTELARTLADSLGTEAVALTLDRHGALVYERGQDAVTVPTLAREVYDVTGAGDMFLAGFAAGRAQGLSWPDATRLANAAAGLEVEVFGVEPIPLERIHHAVVLHHTTQDGVLRTLQHAVVEARAHKAAGRKVVFTNGCFDVLHAGHVSLLETAASFGDVLIVGLNSDASVARLKGDDRPINSADDRARVLGALAAVDAVVLFEDDTPASVIEAIVPDVLVKGADYEGREVVGREVVEAAGGRVELVELVPGRSTTSVIERMRGGTRAMR